MNLAALVTATRDELNEPTAGFWSDTELKRWINRASMDLAESARLAAATSTTVTTVSGTEKYNLPSDFGAVRQVELVDASNSNDFTELDAMSIDLREDDTGEPTGYYVEDDDLYVIPKPDGVYSLRVWYVKRGTTLSADADTPIIPTEFHDLIVLFAVSQAKRKDDDAAFQVYANDYEAGKRDMMIKLRDRQQSDGFTTVFDSDER